MLAFRSALRTASRYNKRASAVAGNNNVCCVCVAAQGQELSRLRRNDDDCQYSRRLLSSSSYISSPWTGNSLARRASSTTAEEESSTDMDSGWLHTPTTNSQEARELYNGWADDIDNVSDDYNYQCPTKVAEKMKNVSPVVKSDDLILDAGCGTGLTGKALKEAGFTNICGIDISDESLAVASKTKAYDRLMPVDMQELPLPFEENSFQAAQCVAVLAYIADAESLMREFCRVVRPGGSIIFTQRDDLFAKRDFEGFIQRMEAEGLWERVEISEPELYYPGSEIYSDKFKVVYNTMRVKA